MIAIEHLIVPCADCGNRGMVAGERCSTCNGQGHVRRDVPAAPEPELAERGTPTTKADARAWLDDHGIDAPKKANLKELLEAVAAEEQRLADAAAAASSGEGDQEGEQQPAGDPDATSSGEAGEPS